MFKVGDKVYPTIGNFNFLTGTVIDVEDRVNGAITVEFKGGQRGLYFKNELARAS